MTFSPTDVINKLTIIYLIIGHSFCYTIAGILYGPASLSGAEKNTALVTFLIDIGTISN